MTHHKTLISQKVTQTRTIMSTKQRDGNQVHLMQKKAESWIIENKFKGVTNRG